MTTPAYPLINGQRHAWSSAIIKLDNVPVLALKSLNYNDNLEPSAVRGTHPQPLGFTQGEYTAESDGEGILQEINNLLKQLGNGFGETVFDVVASYSARQLDTIVDSFQVRIKKIEASQSQGPDALTRKLTFQVMGVIKWDGLTMLSNPLAGSPAA